MNQKKGSRVQVNHEGVVVVVNVVVDLFVDVGEGGHKCHSHIHTNLHTFNRLLASYLFSYSFNTPVGFIVYPLDSLLESTISDPATFVRILL